MAIVQVKAKHPYEFRTLYKTRGAAVLDGPVAVSM